MVDAIRLRSITYVTYVCNPINVNLNYHRVNRNVVDVPILQPHIPLPDTMVDRHEYTETYVLPPLNKGKSSDLNRDDSMGGNAVFILK